ncbi:hypothetical protein PR048_013969 [Dryococelus australis]|uniref:Uncharacterized protein n=1 Tax=Dryococelus australis TaxID=614101 RepID=A0ABQ9HUL1_9NEOP|nr:hypothetical protein PR048_013969 [Dryococelus australis]
MATNIDLSTGTGKLLCTQVPFYSLDCGSARYCGTTIGFSTHFATAAPILGSLPTEFLRPNFWVLYALSYCGPTIGFSTHLATAAPILGSLTTELLRIHSLYLCELPSSSIALHIAEPAVTDVCGITDMMARPAFIPPPPPPPPLLGPFIKLRVLRRAQTSAAGYSSIYETHCLTSPALLDRLSSDKRRTDLPWLHTGSSAYVNPIGGHGQALLRWSLDSLSRRAGEPIVRPDLSAHFFSPPPPPPGADNIVSINTLQVLRHAGYSIDDVDRLRNRIVGGCETIRNFSGINPRIRVSMQRRVVRTVLEVVSARGAVYRTNERCDGILQLHDPARKPCTVLHVLRAVAKKRSVCGLTITRSGLCFKAILLNEAQTCLKCTTCKTFSLLSAGRAQGSHVKAVAKFGKQIYRFCGEILKFHLQTPSAATLIQRYPRHLILLSRACVFIVTIDVVSHLVPVVFASTTLTTCWKTLHDDFALVMRPVVRKNRLSTIAAVDLFPSQPIKYRLGSTSLTARSLETKQVAERSRNWIGICHVLCYGTSPAFTWSDFQKPWKTAIRMAGLGMKPTFCLVILVDVSNCMCSDYISTLLAWGRGGPTVRPVTSHQDEPGSIPGRVPDFCIWESGRTMPLVGRFSRGSTVFPALFPGAAPYLPQSPSSALKTTMLRAAEISSLAQHIDVNTCTSQTQPRLVQFSVLAIENYLTDKLDYDGVKNKFSNEKARMMIVVHEVLIVVHMVLNVVHEVLIVVCGVLSAVHAVLSVVHAVPSAVCAELRLELSEVKGSPSYSQFIFEV